MAKIAFPNRGDAPIRMHHRVLVAQGPKWDLGYVREILAWREPPPD
jgi:hypothetical protein